MLGSTTTPDRGSARDSAKLRAAFRLLNDVGIQNVISWLNTQPGVSPVNASPNTSQHPAHDSGTVSFARLSLYGTRTRYSLPVSRRSQHAIEAAIAC